jgi:hypothetical protein
VQVNGKLRGVIRCAAITDAELEKRRWPSRTCRRTSPARRSESRDREE